MDEIARWTCLSCALFFLVLLSLAFVGGDGEAGRKVGGGDWAGEGRSGHILVGCSYVGSAVGVGFDLGFGLLLGKFDCW